MTCKPIVLAATLLWSISARAGFEIVQEGIDMAPAPQPPAPTVGQTWSALKDGAPYRTEVVAVTGGESSYKDTEGCTWTRSAVAFSPSSEWADCDGNTGSASVRHTGGDPWPMKVGNSWSFDVNGGRWRTDRDCTVQGTARVRIALGEYDTFKVVCEDRWNTRTWYYAPAIEKAVFYERFRRTRAERQQYELAAQ